MFNLWQTIAVVCSAYLLGYGYHCWRQYTEREYEFDIEHACAVHGDLRGEWLDKAERNRWFRFWLGRAAFTTSVVLAVVILF